jgi:prepilin-type processing-associated H-X9-DG protein
MIARDAQTGEMGVVSHSQAFAVGSSVPWALPGYGVIATQSMGEPMYGELGLDALRAGLTASEALTALRSVDPHPERRQVAMVDGHGNFDAYTGAACVEAAGHRQGDGCVALANMVASTDVWDGMVDAFEAADGPLAERLMAALHAAEAAGGDFRGQRSAAILVVKAQRTGRPWRDQVVDLRVDDHREAVNELDRLVRHSRRYHATVEAFELALDGQARPGLERLERLVRPDPAAEPDLVMWRAVVLALAGETADARAEIAELEASSPAFIVAAQRFRAAGLVDPTVLDRILP